MFFQILALPRHLADFGGTVKLIEDIWSCCFSKILQVLQNVTKMQGSLDGSTQHPQW